MLNAMVPALQPLQAQELLVPLQSYSSNKASLAFDPLGAKQSNNQAVALPFFDDFSSRSTGLWEWGGATTGDGAGLLPPTVGVATLDAINAQGQMYAGLGISPSPADTLLSLPLRLENYVPGDSLVLSFYYLPGGGEGNMWERTGDTPEEGDSLLLDFFNPADSSWTTVWGRNGTTVDALVAATGLRWQYVTVGITDSAYFDSTFRFRFRNYCSLEETTKPGMSGNCDFWHIDYVLVDRNRTVRVTPVFRDVAFVAPAPSMLARYRSMPARQFRPSEMAQHLDMVITNLYSSPLASQYAYAVVGEDGDTLYRYNGGYENAPAFLPGAVYQTAPAHAASEVEFAFPTMTSATEYTIVHTVREGSSGDSHGDNDTVCFRQIFGDYYAYDDGTAENGYGITSTSSHLYLACRFDLNSEDTLTAVDIYFNRTQDGENELVPFYITLWRKEGNVPGDTLYRDATARMLVPEGLNRFHRYVLERPVMVSDSIFVGFEQGNNYFINMGFDRSYNSSQNIYYLTGTEWQQSILSGSLMMRPCFGVAATVGITERRLESGEWSVFPNPASDRVNVKGLAEGTLVQLYDVTGRIQLSTTHTQFSTAGLPNGLYLLRLVNPKGGIHTEKLLIQH